jgi:Putative Ig domain
MGVVMRRSFVVVVAMTMSVGVISGVVSPASAKAPAFAGAAPGSVTCALSAIVNFSPRLKNSGGGTDPSAVTGHLSGCNTSTSAVVITRGMVTGSFAESPFNCSTLSSVSASATLTVAWRGAVNGMVGGTAYRGRANFTPSTVTYSGGAVGVYGFSMPGILSTSNVTGSFSGLSTASARTPFSLQRLHAACRHSGIKKLVLTGTIVVGTTTVVVSPTDLVSGTPSQGQFVVINQGGGLGGVGMVFGPATPPRGVGSLRLNVTGAVDHWSVYNYDHIGTRLSDITALGYSSYTDNGTTDPGLQIEIDPGNTSGTDAGVTYSTLNFEPYLQSAGVVPDTWQSWNVLSGKVWGTHLTGAPNSSPLTWSSFLATYPNATIKGGFGLNVGSGWSAMTGEADALTIGAGQSTLYDFEPVGTTAPPMIQITTMSLPPGSAKTWYSTTLGASGGNPPYKWTVSSLPGGLHLHRNTGVISGRFYASDSGTYTFTVRVVDAKIKKVKQNTATRVLSITVS